MQILGKSTTLKKQQMKKYAATVSEAYEKSSPQHREYLDFVFNNFSFQDCIVFSYEQNVLAVKLICKVKNKKTFNCVYHRIWLYFDLTTKSFLNRYLTRGDYFDTEEHYYNNELKDMKEDILGK